MIRKAYHLEDKAAQTDAAIQLLPCAIESTGIFASVVAIHSHVGWRAKYYHAALRECFASMEDGQLFALLAALTKGGNECIGRKRYAFNTLMDLVDPTHRNNDGSDQRGNESDVESARSSPLTDVMEQAASNICAAVEKWLDAYKDTAFRAAFLEPVACYARATGGGDLEAGNAFVHGANTYSAILLSTLGIQLPMQPFLEDAHVHGRRPFLRTAAACPTFAAALTSLSLPENWGREGRAVRACANAFVPLEARVAESFIFPGDTPRRLANAAVDPSPAAAAERRELAPYAAINLSFEKVAFREMNAGVPVRSEPAVSIICSGTSSDSRLFSPRTYCFHGCSSTCVTSARGISTSLWQQPAAHVRPAVLTSRIRLFLGQKRR